MLVLSNLELIRFGADGSPIVEKGIDLVIEGGKVREIRAHGGSETRTEPRGASNGRADTGEQGSAGSDGHGVEIIDCTGRLAMPPLANLHTHASMVLMRGNGDDMDLDTWLKDKIWPAEAGLTPEDVYWGAQLAIAEMLESGAGSMVDMYFHMDEVARAVHESGFKAVLGWSVAELAGHPAVQVARARRFVADWQGKSDRIRPALAPHSSYACTMEFLRQFAPEPGDPTPLEIHLAETRGHVEQSFREYGLSPTEVLHKTGLLGPNTILGHAIHLSDEDRKLVAASGATVAHCPNCNVKMALGIAPVAGLLADGASVGLGTDGAVSNNNLDMIEEMRLAAILPKYREDDPAVVPAARVLSMAVGRGVGPLQGLVPGDIRVGEDADLVLFNTESLRFSPGLDRISDVVYSATSRDVDSVMIQGKFLLRKGEHLTIDVERAKAEVRARGRRLTGRPILTRFSAEPLN